MELSIDLRAVYSAQINVPFNRLVSIPLTCALISAVVPTRGSIGVAHLLKIECNSMRRSKGYSTGASDCRSIGGVFSARINRLFNRRHRLWSLRVGSTRRI